MRVHNGIESYSRDHAPVVASIGNYDGVHLGHQAILARVLEDSGRSGHDSLLISFDPHPLSIVAPQRTPTLIQTRRQKLDHLEHSGLAGLLWRKIPGGSHSGKMLLHIIDSEFV